MRDKIYAILEGESECWISKIVAIIILTAILVSSVAFVFETLPQAKAYQTELRILEIIVVIIFTIEYLLRLITSRERLSFLFTPLNVIDFLSILPFYLELFLISMLNLRILRVIRLIRIFRLFKLSRYSESLAITLKALHQSASSFAILLVLMAILMILFSSFVYFAEHDAHIAYCHHQNKNGTYCAGMWIDGHDNVKTSECPTCHQMQAVVQDDSQEIKCPVCGNLLERPTGRASIAQNFASIPHTFWWCIVTMTTVGYGDVVPQTVIGKIVAGLTMIFGILCIALPTGVMATTFLNVLEEERKKKQSKV